jgi:ribosome-binding protein aMBF1 (putative translation factor)
MWTVLKRIFGSLNRCAVCGYSRDLRRVGPENANLYVCKKCSDQREVLSSYK